LEYWQGTLENMVTAALPDPAFWSRQRVLLTGHTGFKGAWASLWLEQLGATTTALALAPDTSPNLYERLVPYARFTAVTGDIADRATAARAVLSANPTVVLHMAAQPLVRRSYREPVETFATNVMGTANLLEALREAPELKTVLVVTTDKVYRNADDGRDFVEDDPLGGHDPYSASKAAAEIATAAWAESFFKPRGIMVATARAGNVVGGGDWSEDRIVPDIWRAAQKRETLTLRNPKATRPWQHVLEALCGYFVYLERLNQDGAVPTALNFGPVAGDTMTVSEVADVMLAGLGTNGGWKLAVGSQLPETKLLSLDPSRAIAALGWRPRLRCAEALDWTAQWYRRFDAGEHARRISLEQLGDYIAKMRNAPAP
jgi:CDP-glucose 4,6-dehydratase